MRIPDWKSDLTLAVADVATMPRSAKLQTDAGMFLADAGSVAEAEAHLRRAIELAPGNPLPRRLLDRLTR
jgi:Flp pilus assembly protein TadD